MTNLVNNGSFQLGTTTASGTKWGKWTPSTSTSSKISVDTDNNKYNFCEISSFDIITLSQNITLQKGSYVFNYKLTTASTGFGSLNVKILYGNNNTYYNSSPSSGTGPTSVNAGTWRKFEGKFTVNNNNTTITLKFTSDNVYNFLYLTQVSLTKLK